MSCYVSQQVTALGGTMTILAAIVLLGNQITRVRPIRFGRITAWMLVVSSVTGIERLNAHEPAGFRMLAIIAALLYGMKVVVAVEAQTSGARRLSWWRWVGFVTTEMNILLLSEEVRFPLFSRDF